MSQFFNKYLKFLDIAVARKQFHCKTCLGFTLPCKFCEEFVNEVQSSYLKAFATFQNVQSLLLKSWHVGPSKKKTQSQTNESFVATHVPPFAQGLGEQGPKTFQNFSTLKSEELKIIYRKKKLKSLVFLLLNFPRSRFILMF